MGTIWISADIREILITVMPKCAGTSGSKINNSGVSTLKQVCSGRYSGLLKLSN